MQESLRQRTMYQHEEEISKSTNLSLEHGSELFTDPLGEVANNGGGPLQLSCRNVTGNGFDVDNDPFDKVA